MFKALNRKLVDVVKSLGINDLTPIQALAIPKVLSGDHVLIVAPTGSGKTEAALLPVLSMMVDHYSDLNPISAIYITPLRALNRDMFERIFKICKHLHVKVSIRHGDTSSSAKALMTSQPPHILITTPETFSYILVHEKLRRYLSNVRWVIIDEFHELLNSKRGTHLLVDLERLGRIANRFQRIALSASISDLEVAAKALAPRGKVSIAAIPGVRESELRVYSSNTVRSPEDKVHTIAELIRGSGKALVFTNTRDEAELLGVKLASLGLKVKVHHGSLSKEVRENAERELKEGSLDAVVSTSSLELGIDVGHIDVVIQSSSPRQASKLLQRTGRSLHRYGLKARGYVVTTSNMDDILESVVICRRAASNQLEPLTIFKGSADVAAHILVGLGLEGGFTLEEALKIFRSSYPYRDAGEELIKGLTDFLVELGYLRMGEDGRYHSTQKGRLYYLKTTMIVESSQYAVVDVTSGSYIGSLDEEFLAVNDVENADLILSGRVWKVISVDDEKKKVYVEPEESLDASVPYWVGENIPVDYKVAREVCSLRQTIYEGKLPEQHKSYLGSEEALNHVLETLVKHVGKGLPIPTDRQLVIEVSNSDSSQIIVVHSCLGTKGNTGLAYLISYKIAERLGHQPALKVDPYRVFVLIDLNLGRNPEILADVIDEVFNVANVEEVLNDAIMKSTLAKYVARRVLVRMGILPEEAPPQVAKALIKRYLRNDVVASEVLNEIKTKYVDVELVKKFLERVSKGEVKRSVVVVEELSPIAAEGLKNVGGYVRVEVEKIPRDLAVELIKRRLLSKKVKLYCLFCGNSWESIVNELPERITCSKCGSGLIGVYFGFNDLRHIVKKALKHGKNYVYALNDEEKALVNELIDTAKLVLDYGKKAVIALAARGVGPKNAVKA
ncbi:MAG: hypothetical protein B7O98_01155, partial [Zestosphaera tikiterensis]